MHQNYAFNSIKSSCLISRIAANLEVLSINIDKKGDNFDKLNLEAT